MRYSFWVKHTKVVINTFYNSPNSQNDENSNLVAKRKSDDERENSKSNSTTAATLINTKQVFPDTPKESNSRKVGEVYEKEIIHRD